MGVRLGISLAPEIESTNGQRHAARSTLPKHVAGRAKSCSRGELGVAGGCSDPRALLLHPCTTQSIVDAPYDGTWKPAHYPNVVQLVVSVAGVVGPPS